QLLGLIFVPPAHARQCRCETDLLNPDYKNNIEAKVPSINARANLKASAAQYKPAGPTPSTTIGDFDLSSQPGYAGHLPYFVVYADKKIIDGHGDIFNPNFIKFLAEYLSLYRPH